MKQYFAPLFTGETAALSELPLLLPHNGQRYSPEADPQPKAVITLGGECHCLIPKVDKESAEIVGFLTAKKKASKKQAITKDVIAYFHAADGAVLVTKKPHGRVIGYLQTQEENTFIAVTRPQLFIPILLLPFFLVTVMVLVYFCWSPKVLPHYGTDALTDGGLTPTIVAELDPAYFNIKVNATPIIKEGSMNIRVENSARNLYDCYVEVEMEQSGTSEMIYKSPLIQPEQSLEYATIEADYPPGVYDGRARFRFFDNDGNLLGNATVKLIINIM